MKSLFNFLTFLEGFHSTILSIFHRNLLHNICSTPRLISFFTIFHNQSFEHFFSQHFSMESNQTYFVDFKSFHGSRVFGRFLKLQSIILPAYNTHPDDGFGKNLIRFATGKLISTLVLPVSRLTSCFICLLNGFMI